MGSTRDESDSLLTRPSRSVQISLWHATVTPSLEAEVILLGILPIACPELDGLPQEMEKDGVARGDSVGVHVCVVGNGEAPKLPKWRGLLLVFNVSLFP